MIRCVLTDEPANFDAAVRQPGRKWLAKNPHRHPRHDFWKAVVGELAAAFNHRCAYLAIYCRAGQVDHFVSCSEDRDLAYEWKNYRYCDPDINARKNRARSSELLDPCAVEDDWFELILPSLQVRVTERCPPELRGRAEYTLERLRLRDDERTIRMRSQWVARYEEAADRGTVLALLDVYDPLLARALRRREPADGGASSCS